MPAHRPTQPDSRQELLAKLATERRVAPAIQPQAVRVSDLLQSGTWDEDRSDCPHPRQIEDLVAGRIPHKKRPPLMEHLKECPHCRRYVVGLRESCSGPAPYITAKPATGFGLSHVVGLAVAGVLLLLANSTVLDLLDGLEAPAVSVSRPAERTVVPATPAPEPVIAPASAQTAPAPAVAPDGEPAISAPQEAIEDAAAKLSESESLAEPVTEQSNE